MRVLAAQADQNLRHVLQYCRSDPDMLRFPFNETEVIMRELTVMEIEQVSGGRHSPFVSFSMAIIGGWAGGVAGFGVGALIGGPAGAVAGLGVGIAVGAMIGVSVSRAVYH